MAKKGGGSQTVTQKLDPQQLKMIQDMWGAAQTASTTAVPGVNPMSGQAGDVYRDAIGVGNLGFGALSGDPAAYAQLTNPHQSSVIDAMATRYGDIRSDTMRSIDDAATRAGAFGGSRHGVATGQALGDVAQDQANQTAALLYQGHNDAMSRAGQMANLGFGGAGALHGLGDYERNVAMQSDPAMHRYQTLLQAMGGLPNMGGTTSQPLHGGGGAMGALGGAAAGGGLAASMGAVGGPVGWGLAGLGGLLGLFG